ncbi:hypothetical protein B0H14DRAFT_699355 [Mycena olivaceomarginata]|nr:hypothetical protein B0H14DRAFT_699355 [Mycena olivaceomarginata]
MTGFPNLKERVPAARPSLSTYAGSSWRSSSSSRPTRRPCASRPASSMHSFPRDARLHRFSMSRHRARRVYLPLHGAAVRRRRGDQRCHVVSFTPTTILATCLNAHRAATSRLMNFALYRIPRLAPSSPATLNPAAPLAEALPSPSVPRPRLQASL